MRLFTASRVWLIVLAVGLAVSVSIVLTVEPSVTDMVLDKYQAVEAWTGGDPYVTQGELVEKYVGGYGGHDVPSPRSPAAVVLQSLTVPVPDGWMPWVAAVANLATLAAMFWLAGRFGADQRLMAAGFLLWLMWRPGTAIWWNVTNLAGPAVVAGWWLLSRRPRWAGVLFGAAAAVKMWPGLLVVVLLARRDTRRAGWWAVLSGAVLTGVGLLIPGVSVGGTVEAMVQAADGFGAGFVWWKWVLGAVIVLAALRLPADWRISIAVLVGVWLAPIVWREYWLAALPLIGLAYAKVTPNRSVRYDCTSARSPELSTRL